MVSAYHVIVYVHAFTFIKVYRRRERILSRSEQAVSSNVLTQKSAQNAFSYQYYLSLVVNTT
jgi:hypothetical protein